MLDAACDGVIRRRIWWSNPISKALCYLVLPLQEKPCLPCMIRTPQSVEQVPQGEMTNISRCPCCLPVVGPLGSFRFRLNNVCAFGIRSTRTKHARRTIYQGSHLVINDMREFQDLCSCHTSLVLSQRVQPLQSVFHLLLSNQLFHIFS
jgi:hypothetical protein